MKDDDYKLNKFRVAIKVKFCHIFVIENDQNLIEFRHTFLKGADQKPFQFRHIFCELKRLNSTQLPKP